MIKYDKTFELLKKNGWTATKIRNQKILAQGTLHNMRYNLSISMQTIDKLCKLLNCQPGDLIEYVENNNGDSL